LRKSADYTTILQEFFNTIHPLEPFDIASVGDRFGGMKTCSRYTG